MSVEKLPLVTLSEKAVEQVKNAEALGIWVYMHVHPETMPCASICDHFGITMQKLEAIIEYLESEKFLTINRDEKTLHIEDKWD